MEARGAMRGLGFRGLGLGLVEVWICFGFQGLPTVPIVVLFWGLPFGILNINCKIG